MNASRLALISFLAACGGGSSDNDRADAGTSSSDGASPDAPGNVATVHVYDGSHQAVVGRAVAFLGPDDTVVAEVTTDSTGTAAAALPAGGSITVAGTDVSKPGSVVYTYLGVKNGDELTIGTPKRTATSTFDITATVPSTVEPTANEFLFNASCNTNAANETNQHFVSMTLKGDCTSADFYVEAKDSNLKVTSAKYVTGKTVAAGATVDMGTGFTAPVDSTLFVSNANGVTITPALDLRVGSFYPIPVVFLSDITLSNGNGSKRLTHGVIPGSSLEIRVYIQGLTDQFWSTRGAPDDFYDLDLATANLPQISNIAYSPTNGAVEWSQTGHSTDTAGADLTVKGTGRSFEWSIVGPHGDETLHVPHLPASLASFNIGSGDTVRASATIGSFPGGYAKVAPSVFADGYNFFDAFVAIDRRNGSSYTFADGDTAMFVTGR